MAEVEKYVGYGLAVSLREVLAERKNPDDVVAVFPNIRGVFRTRESIELWGKDMRLPDASRQLALKWWDEGKIIQPQLFGGEQRPEGLEPGLNPYNKLM